MPVLIVAGADDAKFVAIAESMPRRSPGLDSTSSPAPATPSHLERPDEATAILRRCLDDSV